MLDDLKKISEIDRSGMLEDVEKFPDQIKETKEIVQKTSLEKLYKIDDIIITGMGGSAISGDILQTFLSNKIDIPIFVNRRYDLPRWTNKNTLVFVQSYSGNTEETLSAFKHAYQKKCQIIAITSGGKLQEHCKKREIPYIQIPGGFQPRAATAYLLFSSLFALKKTGIFKKIPQSEIDETIDLAEEIRNRNKKDVETDKNYAKRIATKIHGKIPQIYGWDIYNPIALRWRQQFNENSKVIARCDEVSECTHNDLVGWSSNPEASKNFSCILFRDDKRESVYLKKRLDFMKKLYNDVAANVIEISIKGEKRLSKMMYAMYIGDFISCYLAILRKTDPTPVDIIDELKEELSKI
ncbi:MAG: bifunctional phosphoglucose/phosphomannose isomerase [Candidatus Thermoplasmatota archaeon]